MSPSEVLVDESGACGILTLNRPKALHALNLNIVSQVISTYSEWLKHGRISHAIIKGAGDKAFCSGGDVKDVVVAAREGRWEHGARFFRAEYTMNYMLGQMSIPQVALLDGIVMGGGAGISMHGPFRIATERTLFAMPECSIGLFPDVGGSIFLNRLPQGVGLFLALTGFQLRGAQALHAGLATHYVPSAQLPALERALADLPSGDLSAIDACIQRFQDRAGADESSAQMEEVKAVSRRYFSGDAAATVPSIQQALGGESAAAHELCGDALQRMSKNSPLSMLVTHRQLQTGRTLSRRQCFEMEFRLAARCCRGPSDFVEGVTCRLIQRGATPRWRHADVLSVPLAELDAFFAPLDFCDELTTELDAIDRLTGVGGNGVRSRL